MGRHLIGKMFMEVFPKFLFWQYCCTAENLSSNPKPFVDDTSLLFVLHNLDTFANEINEDMKKIESWVHQWKTNFNPDLLKQAQESIFLRKRNTPVIMILFSTAI